MKLLRNKRKINIVKIYIFLKECQSEESSKIKLNIFKLELKFILEENNIGWNNNIIKNIPKTVKKQIKNKLIFILLS